MNSTVFQLTFADLTFNVSFLNRETVFYFRPRMTHTHAIAGNLSASREDMESFRSYFPPDTPEPYLEYRCLMFMFARELLRLGYFMFHAFAFRWQDRAWLLTAPPGTGKTTQFQNWISMFPGEIQAISGDMPILHVGADGRIWVHPSAWNGKEDLRGAQAAPLAGLVLLQQGKENQIAKLGVQDALIPLLRQFIAIPETEGECLSVSSFLDQMLSTSPCWKMINTGDLESTRLLRETLKSNPSFR